MKEIADYSFRFPADFLFGTAQSAFQAEGACNRDGKSENMMEYYQRKFAGQYLPGARKELGGQIMSGEMPDDGCFFYDKYEEYIDDMKKTGQNAFRFSISWSRLIPDGVGAINPKAVDFYNRVIDKLLENGIEPFVDVLHWDVPACLDAQGGYENPLFPQWFEHFARACFTCFGDRVKKWSTVNEPCVTIFVGYIDGRFPPFLKDFKRGLAAAHNMLIAHFRAVRAYKSMNLGGKIGAVNAILPVYQQGINEQDALAARRQAEIRFDWWAQPMLQGKYPPNVLEVLPVYRENLPEHYQEDLERWFIPCDFMGINYYCPARTRFDPDTRNLARNVDTFYAQPGKMLQYPAGLFDALMYMKEKYDNIEVYITENGYRTDAIETREDAINDQERINYMREHLRMVVRAIKAGCNVKGYYYWCDADAFEQMIGYSQRFGLTYVDRETKEHCFKKSREFYREVITHRMVN